MLVLLAAESQQKCSGQRFFDGHLVRHACENSCGNSREWNLLLGKLCSQSKPKTPGPGKTTAWGLGRVSMSERLKTGARPQPDASKDQAVSAVPEPFAPPDANT